MKVILLYAEKLPNLDNNIFPKPKISDYDLLYMKSIGAFILFEYVSTFIYFASVNIGVWLVDFKMPKKRAANRSNFIPFTRSVYSSVVMLSAKGTPCW